MEEYKKHKSIVVACRSVQVDLYQGEKCLAITPKTLVWYGAEIQEATDLVAWFKKKDAKETDDQTVANTGDDVSLTGANEELSDLDEYN